MKNPNKKKLNSYFQVNKVGWS